MLGVQYLTDPRYYLVCVYDCLRQGVVLDDMIIGLFVVFLYVFVLLYFKFFSMYSFTLLVFRSPFLK